MHVEHANLNTRSQSTSIIVLLLWLLGPLKKQRQEVVLDHCLHAVVVVTRSIVSFSEDSARSRHAHCPQGTLRVVVVWFLP